MKLSSILPKHSAFNRSQFYDIGGGVKRAALRVQHSVSGVVGTKERVGEANIDYLLDFPVKSNFTGSMVIGRGPIVGVQSTDLLARALEELRPRTSYSFGKVSNTAFDMRALSYALGAAAAVGVGNVDFDVCRTPSGYRTLGTGWSVPDMGDVVLGPEIVTTGQEFATLMSICGAVGISSVTILRDDIPGVDGLHLVGRRLAAFALRVQANILQASFDAMCYGAHKMAFEMGKTVGMRLNGHTDEAGWLRGLMSAPIFPTPVGYVFGTGTHFDGMPLQETIMLDDVFRVVIGDYLEFIALFPVADVIVNGEISVVEATVDNPTRPGDYDLLFESIYQIFTTVKELMCDAGGFHHDANAGGGSLSHYIERDPIDRHFGNKFILPWWYVEPSPLLMRRYEGFDVPAAHGQIVRMPLFKTEAIRHVGNNLDSVGRASPGARSFIVRSPTTLRTEGASYLLSSAYSSDNGLAQLRYVSESPAGDMARLPMMTGDPLLSLAENRWVTPHNPMPNPMEGRCDAHSILEYRHVTRRTDLKPSEMMDGVVESTFGVFFCVQDSPTAPCITHRNIPTFMQRRLKLTTASLTPLVSMEVVNFGSVAALGSSLANAGELASPTQKKEKPGEEAEEESGKAVTVRSEPDKVTPSTAGTPTPTAADVEDEKPKRTSEFPRTDEPPRPDEDGDNVNFKPAPAGVKPLSKTVKPAQKEKDEESGNGPSVTSNLRQE